MGWGISIGEWDWGLVLGNVIEIGDCVLGFGLGFRIRDWYWGLVLAIGIGDWD